MKKLYNLRYYLLKTLYWIKGCWKVLFFFKINNQYFGGACNAPSIYRGGRLFYETIYKQCGYVIVFETRNQKYKIWHLGVLEWRQM